MNIFGHKWIVFHFYLASNQKQLIKTAILPSTSKCCQICKKPAASNRLKGLSMVALSQSSTARKNCYTQKLCKEEKNKVFPQQTKPEWIFLTVRRSWLYAGLSFLVVMTESLTPSELWQRLASPRGEFLSMAIRDSVSAWLVKTFIQRHSSWTIQSCTLSFQPKSSTPNLPVIQMNFGKFGGLRRQTFEPSTLL